ncbi:MAG TPA: hypothetical protein VEN99_02855, partial [Acidimicrobiia bacterium]|nr:hypothetical protein [Acidimicrobiia bacterium]
MRRRVLVLVVLAGGLTRLGMWDAGRPGAVPRSLASTSASAPAPATAPGVTTPVTVAPVVDPEVARAAATTPGETL